MNYPEIWYRHKKEKEVGGNIMPFFWRDKELNKKIQHKHSAYEQLRREEPRLVVIFNAVAVK